MGVAGPTSRTRPTAFPTAAETLTVDAMQMQEAEKRIEVARTTGATALNLAELRLTSVPWFFGQLSRLETLYLQYNELTSLPDSLDQLTRLRGLFLSGNQLTSLPESLGQLTHLELLDLTSNQLTSLPESLRELKRLTRLYLHGNKALGLPDEVLGPTWAQVATGRGRPANPADILDYYFRARAGGGPLNEAKLILLGHGAVGKTSLVKRLVEDRFDRKEKKTEGIRITQWPVKLAGGDDVRLNVWDFGGQEIMHATHQFFLTHRSLYLVVLNGRGGHEDADAEYWLRLVDSFGGDSPVLVVLNKIKEQAFDLNRGGLRERFPRIRGFLETDCADGTGIDALREAVLRETDCLEHLRDPFPASWFAIKDRLAKVRKSFLTFEEYREVCGRNGETDCQAQETLAVHLHSLGIALNYRDDPRLQDTHVLKPRWVTAGIYKILNARKLAEQKGVLRLGQVGRILDPKRYPVRMHGFLFDLMRKFELSFSFPEADGRYLVPELLDKGQPDDLSEFRPEGALNFQYHYPILPEGLLPRFIVRTHVLSEGQSRWRFGVILEFEGNRALVRADVAGKRVSIAVTGPVLGRRRLLAVIRSDFEAIHRDFTFEPHEMVPLPGHPEVLIPYQNLLVMEEQGVGTFPQVVGEKVLQFDVGDLLDGVDLEEERRRGPDELVRAEALRVFFSYAHKDEPLRNELETHLKLFQRRGLIQFWHDRRIPAGKKWKGQIDDNLERADVVLLLVSADFLASDYCYQIEMARALERHEAGQARVVPVIVRECAWHEAPFGKLLALPTDGHAVKSWPDRDSAWRNVAEGIEKVLKELGSNAPIVPPSRRRPRGWG